MSESSLTFWRELRGGRELVNMYGCTEGGGVANSLLENEQELKLVSCYRLFYSLGLT